MKKVTAIMVCLMLLVTAVLSGCSGKGAGTDNETQSVTSGETSQVTEKAEATKKGNVHLSFFTGKTETIDFINEVINKFNEQNPGIVVSQEFQKEASNVIRVKFASGDVPDIITTYEQEYVDQGKYLDLSGEAWWSRQTASMKDSCADLKSGKQYRICTNMTMAGIFYNKSIFSELGLKEAITWQEFKNNLKTIKEKKPDVTPWFIPGKEAWSLGHLIEFLPHGVIKQKYGALEAKKAFLANDQTKLDFGTVGGSMEAFAKNILELKNEGLINSDVITATYDNHVQAFATGKAAIISQGMWVLSGLLAANADLAKDIGFSPYPAYLDGTKPVVLSAEDSGYSITAESKNQAEARKFLDFLFSVENQKSYSELVKSPCAFTDVDANWGVLKDEVNGALGRGVNIGFTNEKPAGFSGDDAGRMVQELLVGKYTSEEFAKAYKEAWDKGIK
ncbi:MAG: hypothetical protein A2Y21_02145 [Clostridiales bacterium GWC2_40_7]|nr:MAG: hypothetical protein A2Y21_02145 [Clostridiales bacterium GWC2_40_7]